LQYSVCTFDIFTEEVFPILLNGGALVIADKDETLSIDCLEKLLFDEDVTIISGFPYLLQDLNNKPLPSSLRLVISGGDVLRKEFVTNFVPKIPVLNGYGPTETTVCASYYTYTGEDIPTDSVPIGKPLKDVEIYILDENLKKVPQGEVGQIIVAISG
jgi:non-ribosomal peptide synthetase component F